MAVTHNPTGSSSAPRLLDRVRDAMRVGHYSPRTEEAYVGWIRRYILFYGKRHPSQPGTREVTPFLTALAVDRDVSASTQNQALGAVLFLYRQVLQVELGGLESFVRARLPDRLPVVLTRGEVRAVMARLAGVTCENASSSISRVSGSSTNVIWPLDAGR